MLPIWHFPFQLHFLLNLIILISINISADGWSEQDEAKRIAQIKAEERREFEAQIGHKLPALYDASSSEEGGNALIVDQPEFQSAAGKNARRSRPSTSSTQTWPPPSAQLLQPPANQSALPRHWCFHCASPWNTLSDPMQRVVRNLLEVRRAQYPAAEAVTRECVQPRHLDRLPRQLCQGYSHCQTLVLTDHNAGAAFTIRGCAERFGAVDLGVLGRHRDNSCRRLHDKVDIQECICEKRKYCYAGTERRWATQYTGIDSWQGPLLDSAVPQVAALKNSAGSRSQHEMTAFWTSFYLTGLSLLLTLMRKFQ